MDTTSMDQVPVTDLTRLLSDNGPGYVSRAFRHHYLGMVGIKHILATPFHPQTNGQAGALPPDHQTGRLNHWCMLMSCPPTLRLLSRPSSATSNYRRPYHKALGNVPTIRRALKGRRQEILQRRKEVKAQQPPGTATTLQQGPQGAHRTSAASSDLSPTNDCPTFAGC